jgi:hypothetical protein
MINEDNILDLLVEWFTDYADENLQIVSVNSDGIARINGEFDLEELAAFLFDQI